MLCEGQKAPNFTLQATGRRTVSLSDFRGRRNVVLFFYHSDNHPLCTAEVESFRDLYDDFASTGTAVIGISSDHQMSHESFARKNRLQFPLLSDEDRIVWNAYYSCSGRKHLLVDNRLTCVIDRDGNVRKIWPEVIVDGHAAEVLAVVCTLRDAALL